MRSLCLSLMALLVFGIAYPVLAQEAEGNDAYEAQLQTYSKFFGDLVKEGEKQNEEQRMKNEKLKIAEMQLNEEYDDLKDGMETKEESIERLKNINQKMKKAQSAMYGQYSELEKLFDQQKKENEILKKELEDSKASFYQKMVEFYEAEYTILNDKIKTMEDRRNEVGAKLEMMKKSMDEVSE